MPGSSVLHYLPEFAQTHVHWVSDLLSNHLYPLLPLSLALNLSQHQGLHESVLHIRWPKYGSFSFSISLSDEYSELISFRTDWFDFLAVQGTLESLLQHHSLKTSVLQHLAFFYGPTLTSVHDYWKNHSFESVLESFLHLCLKWETDWKFRLSFLVCHVMLRKVLSDGLGLIAIVFLDRYQMTL